MEACGKASCVSNATLTTASLVGCGEDLNSFAFTLCLVLGVLVIAAEVFPLVPAPNLALVNKVQQDISEKAEAKAENLSSSSSSSDSIEKEPAPLSAPASALMYHQLMFLVYGALFWALFLFAPRQPLYLVLAAGLFIRQFEEKHEIVHYPISLQTQSPLHWVVWFEVVTSPFQLSVRDAGRAHMGHHRAHDTKDVNDKLPTDPDDYLVSGPIYSAAFHAMTEPEQALFRYMSWSKQTRFDTHQILTMIWKNIQCLALLTVIPDGAWFLLVTRVLNWGVWFIFHHLLHRFETFSTGKPVRLPLPIRVAWRVMFGEENLNAIMFHALHHEHPSIPANSLHMLANYFVSKGIYPKGV